MKTKSMVLFILALSFILVRVAHAETYVSDCLTLTTDYIDSDGDERRALESVKIDLLQTKTCGFFKNIPILLDCIGTCKQNRSSLKYISGGAGMGHQTRDFDLNVPLTLSFSYIHSGPVAHLSYLNREGRLSTRMFYGAISNLDLQ